jgi:hypothetical protein
MGYGVQAGQIFASRAVYSLPHHNASPVEYSGCLSIVRNNLVLCLVHLGRPVPECIWKLAAASSCNRNRKSAPVPAVQRNVVDGYNHIYI